MSNCNKNDELFEMQLLIAVDSGIITKEEYYIILLSPREDQEEMLKKFGVEK